MEKDVLNKIRRKNKKYEANYHNGKLETIKNYKVLIGKRPILLSAPHSVRQVRNGKIKESDRMTGAIVEYLCDKFDTFGIIRTCNLGDDPNFSNDLISLSYKEEIIQLIKKYGIIYLFDIHGCADKYDFDIDIGINDGNNLTNTDELNKVKNLLSDKFLVTIDGKFKASKPHVVSNYVHKIAKIDCFQLELSNHIRTNSTKLNDFIKVFEKIANDGKIIEKNKLDKIG